MSEFDHEPRPDGTCQKCGCDMEGSLGQADCAVASEAAEEAAADEAATEAAADDTADAESDDDAEADTAED